MKKIIITIIIINIIYISLTTNFVQAESNLDQTTIIEEQEEAFGIKEFLQEAKKYTSNLFDLSEIFENAISGNIDNTGLLKKIISLLGNETTNNIKILVNILIIVLIHSILKSITDSLENNGVSKIVYYAQYILIVTLIMSNFSEIIQNVKDTIEDLVGFSEMLIPLLTTLMLYTGSITTTTLVEPIILFLVEFISNIIKELIIPVVSIITALIIVSKITDKVQIDKISKFMKSSIVWVLGTILTLFIGVLSLEGTLTSSIDGITAKTAKATISSLIPVVRQNIRGWSR